MRWCKFGILILAVICLLASGCSSNLKGKIEGTKWSSDAMNVKGNVLPAGVLKLEFSKTGKLIYTTGPTVHDGTYSLGIGDRVTFHMNQDLGGSKTHMQTIKIAGNKLTLIDGDGTSGTFSKVAGG
jgi:hypothetical protein